MPATSERLSELLRAVGGSRRRLEALAQRLSALAGKRPGGHSQARAQGEGGDTDEVRLFEEDGPGEAGGVDESELDFEALDIEGTERESG
jgi:hypothetical protein